MLVSVHIPMELIVLLVTMFIGYLAWLGKGVVSIGAVKNDVEHVRKDVDRINHALNGRPADGPTVSDDIIEIKELLKAQDK